MKTCVESSGVRRICVEPGCAGMTLSMAHVTCPRHGSQTRQTRKMAKVARQGTKSTHWVKLREQALRRDHHTCKLRVSRNCAGVADTVHLDPRLGGNHRIATLADCVSACRSCHGTVDAPRATAA
jgi:5-methylcytosine-specific restriction endonuclease McrA